LLRLHLCKQRILIEWARLCTGRQCHLRETARDLGFNEALNLFVLLIGSRPGFRGILQLSAGSA
jgi:hypothetical protein